MKILNALGFVAFLFVTSQTAFAHTMNADQCMRFAKDSYTVATMRDNGIPIETVATQLVAFLNQLPPSSYIKDTADVDTMIQMLQDAYASKLSPREFAWQKYADCMNGPKV